MNLFSNLKFRSVALLLAAIPSVAVAQDCSDVLIQNVISTATDRYSSYAYYNLIDTEEEYTSEKSGSGSGDVLGLISVSGSFNDYMERRKQQLSITSMSMESAFAERILLATVSDGQVTAWRDCMAGRGEALVVYLTDITDTAATLVVDWDPASGVAPQQLTSAEVRGITAGPGSANRLTSIASRLPEIWDEEKNPSLIVDRVQCKEMRVSINIGGYSDSLTVPACPPKEPIEVVTTPLIQTQVFPGAGSAGAFPTARSCLAEGWKLIGGGAHVDYGASQGVLLTSSYPDGRCWASEAKAHTVGASGTVTAFAIGLYDPKDEWVVEVYLEMGSRAAIPQAFAAVPRSLTLTGCGGRIDWKGYGNLLTGVFPSSEGTCSVFGKQHFEPDPATATAYAIGIRPRNGSELPVSTILTANGGASMKPNAAVTLPPNCLISGGGANIDWSGTQGVLLTSSMPTGNGWTAAGKAHSVPANAPITAYVMGVCK